MISGKKLKLQVKIYKNVYQNIKKKYITEQKVDKAIIKDANVLSKN